MEGLVEFFCLFFFLQTSFILTFQFFMESSEGRSKSEAGAGGKL